MWQVQGRFHILNIFPWELWWLSYSVLFYQTVEVLELIGMGGWFAVICCNDMNRYYFICTDMLHPGNAMGPITLTGSPQQPTPSCLLTGRRDWRCHLRGSDGGLMGSLCEKPCCHTCASNNGNLTSKWENVLGKHRRYWFSQSKPEHGVNIFHVSLHLSPPSSHLFSWTSSAACSETALRLNRIKAEFGFDEANSWSHDLNIYWWGWTLCCCCWNCQQEHTIRSISCI